MAWLRIDDRIRTHPKIVKAGPAAAWFWLCAVCYCREHLTDGLIPSGMMQSLAPGVTNGKALASRLVEAGLWHARDDGYEIHDFLTWNPSRAEVEDKRAQDRDRKGKGNILDSERKINGPTTESAPYAGAGALARARATSSSALGSESSEGDARGNHRPPPLIVSPLRYAKAQESFAFFGDRLKVPHVLHQEFAGKLGRHAEQLPAWYASLNDAASASGEPIPDVFTWLRPKFVTWAQGMAGGDELAKFVRGEV